MKKITPTNGNWTMNVTNKFIGDKRGLAITANNGKEHVLIAHVSHDLADKSMDEYVSNAEIIRASKDMYETLLKVDKYFVELQNSCALSIRDKSLWKKVTMSIRFQKEKEELCVG